MTELSSAKVAQAWTTFWATQGPGSRCLACAPESFVTPLDAHWLAFAQSLSPDAQVLDLGCGAGAVGRELVRHRSRLHVTGIDIAIVPSSGDERVALVSCTPMELLPFPARSFEAAVSQFGYEYAKTEDAAAEAARVLASGSPISFLVHHPESPVVAGMRLHQRALEGLCRPALKSAFLDADVGAFDKEVADLKRTCRGDPIIDQAAFGIRAHIGQDAGRRAAVWNAVDDALEPERIMLAALDHCAIGNPDIGYWTRPLSEFFDLEPSRVVRARSGEAIAWAIEGRRRS